MTKIRVREGTEADLDDVVRALEAVASEEVHIGTESPIDQELMKRRIRQAYVDNEEAVLFVVEDRGRVVGWLNLASRDGLADLGMGLLPDYRGQGLGSQLMERCLKWCRDHSCHKITLEVWPHNRAAIRLYEKFGFEQEGYKRRERMRKNGEIWDVVQMGLVLEEQDQ